eukprot:2288779-Prymnesium_polylepis.1
MVALAVGRLAVGATGCRPCTTISVGRESPGTVRTQAGSLLRGCRPHAGGCARRAARSDNF